MIDLFFCFSILAMFNGSVISQVFKVCLTDLSSDCLSLINSAPKTRY